MRHKLITCAALGLGLSINTQAAAPSVAVDIAPLHSLVSQVMEGVGTPKLLIPAEASPHHYTLRPSEAKALSDANLVFWIGESYTPWLEKAIDNVASSAHIIEALEIEGTVTYAFREGATFEGHDHGDHDDHDDHEDHDEHKEDKHDHHAEEKHDDHGKHDDHDKHDDHNDDHDKEKHAHHDEHKEDKHDHHAEEKHASHDKHDDHDDHKEDGHQDHEGHDPHAWLDPENAKLWVNSIRDELSKQDPENASTYAANAVKTIASLDAFIESTHKTIDSLGKPKFIVFHDAYQYFEKRFDIPASGSISLGHAQEPSPARIKEIRETVKKLGVTCVFSEPQFNPGLVRNVFEGTEVTIGVMDPLGAKLEEGKNHYQQLIEGMTASLSECK